MAASALAETKPAHYTGAMRSLAALLLLAAVMAAEAASPVLAALLRSLSPAQAAALGAAPSLEAAGRAVPPERRDSAVASLAALEPGAPPATLEEIARAYLLLARPADAQRAAAAVAGRAPGVDALAFQAWVASQAGDMTAAAAAARAALKLSPGRPDALAILKLTEGRESGRTPRVPAVAAPVASAGSHKPSSGGGLAVERDRQGRAGLRLVAEAIRARDMGDHARALDLARRAAAADPSSPEPAEFLRVLEADAASPANLGTHESAQKVAETLMTMRRSRVGAEISSFLVDHHVRIETKAELPAGTLAMYSPQERAIFIPTDFGIQPLIVRALLLSHEGFHAMQDMKYRSAITLETELDATIRGFAAYHELIEVGLPDMPAEHELKGLALAFDMAVREGKVREFSKMVKNLYEDNAELRKRTLVRKVPAVLHKIVLHVVSGFPPFHNATRAADLKVSFWGRIFVTGKKLETAQLRHAEELRWISQWQKERH